MDIHDIMGEAGFYIERPRYHEDPPGIAMIQVPYIEDIAKRPFETHTLCSIIYPYSSQENLLGCTPILEELSENMRGDKANTIIFKDAPKCILKQTHHFLGDLFFPINSRYRPMGQAIDMTRHATDLFLRYLASGANSNLGEIPYLSRTDLTHRLKDIPGFF